MRAAYGPLPLEARIQITARRRRLQRARHAVRMAGWAAGSIAISALAVGGLMGLR